MSSRPLPETIPFSYLNAFEYCPRRFHYEFVQGDMVRNEFVLEGTLLHQNADKPGQQKTDDGDVQINRLYLYSERLHLSGFTDIVEEKQGIFIPVEYKHGKEGRWLNDHLQLCAQALCLEERLVDQSPIPYGSIFYFGSRKRVQVEFTEELRSRTQTAVDLALQLSQRDTPPQPLEGKIAIRCRDCSLHSICLPEEVKLLTRSR